MKKKTAWIINHYAGSVHHGMIYRHYYLAKEFVKNGYDAYIFAGSHSHLFTKFPEIKGDFTFENIDGIKYCWVKIPASKAAKSISRAINMLAFMFQLFKFKINSIPKPDVIIVSSPTPFPIINGYFWAKIFKAKLIFEVRDLWPLSLIELNNMSKYHPFVMLIQWLENFAYKKADRVVSLLPNAKEYMMAHGMAEEKFIHISNGIDLEELQNIIPLEQDIIKIIPKDKFIVGYTGTLGIANAMDTFVETAKILKDNKNIHFIIVGNGGLKNVKRLK